MSLQIWLPLNGTMKNQGLLGDLTQTATPTYDIGKTGQALVTGGCKMSAEQASQVLNNNEFSICFWVYINDDTGSTGNRYLLFGNDNPTATITNRKYSLFLYPTVNDLHWSWQNNTPNVSFTSGVLSGVLPSYKWTHVAVTYRNPNGTVYINGAKVKEFTGVSDSSSFAHETNVIWNNSAGTRMFNDYRVYDNCISAKEVKEISKALVLHYKLGGYGGENYIHDSMYIKPSGCGYNNSTLARDTVTLQEGMFSGTFYRITKGSTGGGDFRIGWNESSIPIDHSIYNDHPITYSVWVKSTTGTKLQVRLGRYSDKDIENYKSYTIVKDKWTFIVHTTNNFVSSSGNSSSDALEIYHDISYDTDIIMAFAKLEINDKATSWCPNREDALYTTLGFNDGIERDCSGMGNDGTMSGTFLWNSDSARHEGSYIFTNSPVQFIYRPYLSFLTGPFTVSCWCYQTNVNTTHGSGTSTTQFIVSQGRDYLPDSTASYGFNITIYGGNIFAFVGRSGLSSGISALNIWRMCTLVYDGTKAYLYIDGVLRSSAIVTSPTYENSSYAFVVGKMSCSYTSTEYFFPFVGNISDVRIYATALSASDVKALYDNTISIDKNGNIHAYDFKEE